MEAEQQDKRIDRLAREVLLLSRNTLLVHLRFLDSALSRLALTQSEEEGIATDGRTIRYNPKHILKTYYGERDRTTRDYLHTVLHCAFRHAFVDPGVNRDCWDLACDIAVECAIDSMELACVKADRQEKQPPVLLRLVRDGVLLTAEKLYRYFLDQELDAETLRSLRAPFLADVHEEWYRLPAESDSEDGQEDEDGNAPSSGSKREDPEQPQADGAEGAKPEQAESGEEQEPAPQEAEEEQAQNSERQEPDGDGESDDGEPEAEEDAAPETGPEPGQRRGREREQRDGDGGDDGQTGEDDAAEIRMEGEGGGQAEARPGSGADGSEPDQRPVTRRELEEQWADVARRMKVDMETGPRMRGDRAGAMMQSLKAVTREEYDYSDFLRQFAVPGEAVQINDDEFDYIYYTYGLDLYGKMPLIEPLEYKEVKRIREFVIAIDTSGSVKGEQVQRFIQKTYNILMEQESFFTKINLHIIQCDAAIQEVRRIATREDFDDYLATMELKGFGGTDFRPVFAYVDRMLAEKEFINLKGLIYFTDGQGVYPAVKPGYDAAFVFVRDDYELPRVPVWAIRLVLDPGDI